MTGFEPLLGHSMVGIGQNAANFRFGCRPSPERVEADIKLDDLSHRNQWMSRVRIRLSGETPNA